MGWGGRKTKHPFPMPKAQGIVPAISLGRQWVQPLEKRQWIISKQPYN